MDIHQTFEQKNIKIIGIINTSMISTIFVFLFYLQIILENDAYTCNKVITTPFKTTKDFVNCMTSKSFFDKYLKIVKGEQIKYIPDMNQMMSFPQIIQYRAIPDIPLIPSFMLAKINIQHQWNRVGDVFIGEVSTKFISFNVNLSTQSCGDDTSNNIRMRIEGRMIDKISILPNHALDILLEQFGGIFLHIMGS